MQRDTSVLHGKNREACLSDLQKRTSMGRSKVSEQFGRKEDPMNNTLPTKSRTSKGVGQRGETSRDQKCPCVMNALGSRELTFI